ncbi:hypothetical protein [Sphingobacterium hungaricum]|uniref:Uncharacterized protein n=1 Tax=Sphingobacterium hungaricum TaxID=2082723 RepID=A0A928YRB9_9SPHI|nr:hypothetical protein [Sphingobacterium hungaricum]MBE8715151.1 hypothetical protein [Sphingobacterium hungaricum]
MNSNIPKQIEGNQVDCRESIQLPSLYEAEQFYRETRSRLLDVNNWHRITKSPSAKFCIIDELETKHYRQVRINDFIRIDIPGPGLPSAGGFDWVQVEQIDEEKKTDWQRITLTLRPCADPTNDNPDTAHFYKKISTSTLVVEQKATDINLHFAGRNEVINKDNEQFSDNFRNFLIGLFAKMGISFPQWKALIQGLIEPACEEYEADEL